MEATELNLSNVPYLIGGWWAHVPTSPINMEFQQQPSSYSSSDLSLEEEDKFVKNSIFGALFMAKIRLF